MNVYVLEAYGNYAHGVAIVAASNEKQAMKLAVSSIDPCWNIRYDKPSSIKVLPVIYEGKKASILFHAENGE